MTLGQRGGEQQQHTKLPSRRRFRQFLQQNPHHNNNNNNNILGLFFSSLAFLPSTQNDLLTKSHYRHPEHSSGPLHNLVPASTSSWLVLITQSTARHPHHLLESTNSNKKRQLLAQSESSTNCKTFTSRSYRSHTKYATLFSENTKNNLNVLLSQHGCFLCH